MGIRRSWNHFKGVNQIFHFFRQLNPAKISQNSGALIRSKPFVNSRYSHGFNKKRKQPHERTFFVSHILRQKPGNLFNISSGLQLIFNNLQYLIKRVDSESQINFRKDKEGKIAHGFAWKYFSQVYRDFYSKNPSFLFFYFFFFFKINHLKSEQVN